MKILALEFSTARRSVAIAADRRVLASAFEEGGRETHAFALIDDVLGRAGLSRRQVDAIAVGVGPGSYAGIRIAIAIAQGWKLATGAALIPVPGAEAVAFQVHEGGYRGRLRLLVDAQRGEFYASTYAVGEQSWTQTQPFSLCAGEADEQVRSARMDVLEHARFECLPPQAAAVARLAFDVQTVEAPELEPIYLRKAQFVKAPPPRTDLGL